MRVTTSPEGLTTPLASRYALAMSTVITRRLVLLRHAKAEQNGSNGDELRPLAVAGRRQAAAVGRSLAGAGLIPEVVLCSSALRTRQTWQLLGAALTAGAGAPEVDVEMLDAVYHAGPRELLELLAGVDSRVRTVLVVGHEPTVSRTAMLLVGQDSDPGAVAQVRVGVSTGTYAELEWTGPWAQIGPAALRLTRVVRPAA